MLTLLGTVWFFVSSIVHVIKPASVIGLRVVDVLVLLDDTGLDEGNFVDAVVDSSLVLEVRVVLEALG